MTIGYLYYRTNKESIASFLDVKCAHSRIYGGISQLFLYAEQLIVFCNAFGTAWRTGLDLAGIKCDSKIRDRRIGRLAGTM